MTEDRGLIPAIFEGWRACQEVMTTVIARLSLDQLALRAAPNLRSVGEIAAHIIGARARRFYLLVDEGGDAFNAFGRWERRGGRPKARKKSSVD